MGRLCDSGLEKEAHRTGTAIWAYQVQSNVMTLDSDTDRPGIFRRSVLP